MDTGLQALFWFVLKKRTRNSRLTARAILQRSASERMYRIRRKNKAYGSPINSPCIALHCRKASSPRHGYCDAFFVGIILESFRFWAIWRALRKLDDYVLRGECEHFAYAHIIG